MGFADTANNAVQEGKEKVAGLFDENNEDSSDVRPDESLDAREFDNESPAYAEETDVVEEDRYTPNQ